MRRKNFLKINQNLSNKILEFEKKLKNIEVRNESYNDDSHIQELEDQVKTLNERNKSLNLTCAQLIRKPLDYLKQIKEFEENKRKNISMLVKGNGKFEKIFTIGKECKDMIGLGCNSKANVSSLI